MSSKKKQQNIYTTAAKRLAAYQAEQEAAKQVVNKRTGDVRMVLIAVVASISIALLSQWTYFGFGPGKSTPAPSSSVAASASPSASSAVTEGDGADAGASSQASQAAAQPTQAPAEATVPDKALAENRTWTGTMTINDQPLGLTLFGDKAPQAVANFVSLVNKGFYNNMNCHRLTTSGIYVLQCGDPKGDGSGGPGYKFGPLENTPSDDIYRTGDLAMARVGFVPDSMGSQFFIVYKDSSIPKDNIGGYTIFGKVSNLSYLDKIIAAGAETGQAPGDGKPKLPALINNINVK